jgi:hypothetical protein
MKKALPFIIPFLVTLFFFSCRKDNFIMSPEAVVHFSSDTVFFDTVFTTAGSVTQPVKIINGNNQKLHLSEVRLMGGTASFFSINIDGSPGPVQTGIDLEANDSIYVFVAVKIDPRAGNLPFVIRDSVLVSFNGTNEYIQLQAWGQNAHFLTNQTITGHVTWSDSIPYVILGGLRVDSNAMLTIPAGSHVYMHADAPLLVDGSLQVTGNAEDSARVYFQGDRLDDPYDDFPAGWPGIYFRETSVNNNLQFAVIRNAYQAVVISGPPVNGLPQLVLNQCIVDNSYDAGLLAAQSYVQATDCLFSNCGKDLVIAYGGNYQFTHCTAVGYTNDFIMHSFPVLSLSNAAVSPGGSIVTAPLQASFVNCIFWGEGAGVQNEVVVSQQGTGSFSANFSNCLWKVASTPSGITSSHIIANQDPLFDSVDNFRRVYDFRLKAGSPAINQGVMTGVLIDLDGSPRAVGLPDLGAYEKH